MPRFDELKYHRQQKNTLQWFNNDHFSKVMYVVGGTGLFVEISAFPKLG